MSGLVTTATTAACNVCGPLEPTPAQLARADYATAVDKAAEKHLAANPTHCTTTRTQPEEKP